MDLLKAIRELHAEKKRLTRVIATLEEMMAAGVTDHGKKKKSVHRGRKSMSAEERRQVSERMAKYWAARRAQNAGKLRPT